MDERATQETIRDEQGRFVPGVSGNPSGRPVETEEQKLKRKATEIVLQEYIEELSQALPHIQGPLLDKAKGGDVSAIKEIHDRVFGKPKQNIDVKGEMTSKVVSIDE